MYIYIYVCIERVTERERERAKDRDRWIYNRMGDIIFRDRDRYRDRHK